MNEFLQKYRMLMNGIINFTRPHVICKDGFQISVQAGQGIYSTPRYDSDSYSAVELGFPNRREELIAGYAEDSRCQTRTVYPYVPIELIDEVIEKHGGIDWDLMPSPEEWKKDIYENYHVSEKEG